MIFETVKTETGLHWHTDVYKCVIIKNPLYFFSYFHYGFDVKKHIKPYYKKIIYDYQGENMIQWLNDNVRSVCYVKVIRDFIGSEDNGPPLTDIKNMTIFFSSKVDVMAFKLKWS